MIGGRAKGVEGVGSSGSTDSAIAHVRPSSGRLIWTVGSEKKTRHRKLQNNVYIMTYREKKANKIQKNDEGGTRI